MIDPSTEQDWLAQASQEIDRLPTTIGRGLSFVSGVIATHPSAQARASALHAISSAARSMRLVIASDDQEGDHMCPICDAEEEAGE